MSKTATYENLAKQLRSLMQAERDMICNMANFAATLYEELDDVSWVGFYRVVDGSLLLGPFQGKTACMRIQIGRGVCGTAASRKQTIVVPNVNQFQGHIACDALSRSEIVIPLLDANRNLQGVLDLDSYSPDRFDQDDRVGLERLVDIFLLSTKMIVE